MKSQDDPLLNWKRPRIVVRKRTHNEQRELAINLACKELKSTSLLYAALAVPTLLVDYVLWFCLANLVFHVDWNTFLLRNAWNSTLLSFCVVWITITLQTSFIGSLVTQYLGLWLFAGGEKVGFKRVLKSWGERWGQTFYYLLLTRPIRLSAFYTEVILLERLPFYGSHARLSTRRRVKNINSGGVGSEALSCFIGTEFYVVSGMVAALMTLAYLTNVVVDDVTITTFTTIVFHMPILAVACRFFNVVYNFCRYINYRIVSEGWDVELRFKTELARLGEFGNESGNGSGKAHAGVLAPLGLDADEPAADSAAPGSTSGVMSDMTIEKETRDEN